MIQSLSLSLSLFYLQVVNYFISTYPKKNHFLDLSFNLIKIFLLLLASSSTQPKWKKYFVHLDARQSMFDHSLRKFQINK